jgi:hypothetical protein
MSVNMISWERRHKINIFVVKCCVKVIRLVCKGKDNTIADMLHEAGGMYQSRPQNGWACPKDWDCWEESLG